MLLQEFEQLVSFDAVESFPKVYEACVYFASIDLLHLHKLLH